MRNATLFIDILLLSGTGYEEISMSEFPVLFIGSGKNQLIV
jgi:hypothetical protein